MCNTQTHCYPFSHSSVLEFIFTTASRRDVGVGIEDCLAELEESDPIRQFVSWVVLEKGKYSILHIREIPIEELRIKMATLGFPTTQEELEASIPRYVPRKLEPEEIEYIKQMMVERNIQFSESHQ